MLKMVTTSSERPGWMPVNYHNLILQAKKRLRALHAGLIPMRITGTSYRIQSLLREGQSVPSQIVAQAEEATRRLPGSIPAVYGWEPTLTPEERRRRDPVLGLHYGGSVFFLGFWMEVETPDTGARVPEFFGWVAPFLPQRGRGRPRKHALKGA